MRPISINSYLIDSKNRLVVCDGRPIGCVEIATKAQIVSRCTFGIFQWLYFYALDLFAHLSGAFKERQFSETRNLSEIIIKGQEDFINRRDKIQQFAKKNFKIVSNVDHLDEAEIICFGEQHHMKDQMHNNALLIDALSESDDLLLLEYDEKTMRTPDQARFVNRPLRRIGWDKRDMNREAVEQIELGFNQPNMKEAERIFVQKVIDGFPERTLHLCKTIEENYKKDRRIYLIAGSDHLMPPKPANNSHLNMEPHLRSFKQISECLQTKKYAVLVPICEEAQQRLEQN